MYVCMYVCMLIMHVNYDNLFLLGRQVINLFKSNRQKEMPIRFCTQMSEILASFYPQGRSVVGHINRHVQQLRKVRADPDT